MPVSSQPDQPYGQIITDEAALEKLFRAHYPRLLAETRTKMPEAHSAAPRVVSKAFHLAWNEKKRFHSMEELNAFLQVNIQHGAAREISRRAGLHRMDAHTQKEGAADTKHDNAEMTVDEAWDRLHHTLQGGAPEAYRARASSARHEAADHMAALGKERDWKPFIGIGVVALVAAVGAVIYLNKAGESRATGHALARPDVRAYEMAAGQQANVTLDDSTVVRIGPESKLTVPKMFGINLRAVKIEGTANFNVKKADPKRPFDVRAGDVAILATGTNFTVRHYKTDDNVLIHVREGSVNVVFGEAAATRTVAAGNALSVSNAGAFGVPSAEDLAEASTWVDGNVTLPGKQLRDVLPLLKRWYNMDMHVPDARLLDRKVFVTAPLQSPKEAIVSIEKSGGLHFTYVGENMALEDTVPSKAAKGKPATKAATKKK